MNTPQHYSYSFPRGQHMTVKTKANLRIALEELDPFQDAVPCWQREDIMKLPLTDHPLADYSLTSYRYKGRFGWIMIGAKDTADALSEASRSTTDIDISKLEIWDGQKYIPVRLGR
jgi:hypothetical protein